MIPCWHTEPNRLRYLSFLTSEHAIERQLFFTQSLRMSNRYLQRLDRFHWRNRTPRTITYLAAFNGKQRQVTLHINVGIRTRPSTSKLPGSFLRFNSFLSTTARFTMRVIPTGSAFLIRIFRRTKYRAPAKVTYGVWILLSLQTAMTLAGSVDTERSTLERWLNWRHRAPANVTYGVWILRSLQTAMTFAGSVDTDRSTLERW